MERRRSPTSRWSQSAERNAPPLAQLIDTRRFAPSIVARDSSNIEFFTGGAKLRISTQCSEKISYKHAAFAARYMRDFFPLISRYVSQQ
jgi:hypothetical protein